jgi:hypothetical protein
MIQLFQEVVNIRKAGPDKIHSQLRGMVDPTTLFSTTIMEHL